MQMTPCSLANGRKQIWGFRNRSIFDSSTPRRSVIFDDIVALSFNWVSSSVFTDMVALSFSGEAACLRI
ncbi:hypothetical protein Tco_0563090, partial [Tanacetum coccineum]